MKKQPSWGDLIWIGIITLTAVAIYGWLALIPLAALWIFFVFAFG